MATRRFLVAPALARLIRQNRAGTPITEGFFEQRSNRGLSLRIKGRETHLVLSTPRDGEEVEETAEIPAEHAVVLLASAAGRVSFEQSSLMLTDGQEVLVRRYNGPSALAVASVSFPNRDAAERFTIPVWFGSEVTGDGAYTNRGLALSGLPRLGELSISDPALNAVMDLFDKQPKPAREQPAPVAEAPADAELPPETLSALTAGMERAIAGAAEGETERDAGPGEGGEERRRIAAVSQIARTESNLARLRASLVRDDRDAAVGS